MAPGGVEPPPADSKFGESPDRPRPTEMNRLYLADSAPSRLLVSSDLGGSGGPTVAPASCGLRLWPLAPNPADGLGRALGMEEPALPVHVRAGWPHRDDLDLLTRIDHAGFVRVDALSAVRAERVRLVVAHGYSSVIKPKLAHATIAARGASPAFLTTPATRSRRAR